MAKRTAGTQESGLNNLIPAPVLAVAFLLGLVASTVYYYLKGRV